MHPKENERRCSCQFASYLFCFYSQIKVTIFGVEFVMDTSQILDSNCKKYIRGIIIGDKISFHFLKFVSTYN